MSTLTQETSDLGVSQETFIVDCDVHPLLRNGIQDVFPYMTDAWQRRFQYYAPTDDPARPFDLFSLGADGQPNTTDDISVWDE